MENRGGEVHVTTDEARGGSTPHIVRWILGISLLAAIVLLSAVWMTGAATRGPSVDETSAQGQLAADANDDTSGAQD